MLGTRLCVWSNSPVEYFLFFIPALLRALLSDEKRRGIIDFIYLPSKRETTGTVPQTVCSSHCKVTLQRSNLLKIDLPCILHQIIFRLSSNCSTIRIALCRKLIWLMLILVMSNSKFCSMVRNCFHIFFSSRLLFKTDVAPCCWHHKNC